MSSILVKVEREGGVQTDESDEVASIDGLGELCGWDTRTGCRASAAPLWAWEHGGTFCQKALCIFQQRPSI